MITTFILILAIAVVGLLLQDRFKVPLPVTLVAFVMLSKMVGLDYFHISPQTFDQIILLLLPILITVDALNLRTAELFRHAFGLFYLAVLSVVLSVLACVLLNKWILPDYNLSVPAVIALFCMVMATDPIAVSAVFGNFKVPHNLKILAEGESLFNDATALILFGLAITMMGPSAIDVVNVGSHSAMVIIGAIGVGIVCGLVGLWLMSLTTNSTIETMLMLLIACGSYVGAEHFHWSGILATIISVLTANHVISKRLDADDKVVEDIDMGGSTSIQRFGSLFAVHQRYADAVIDRTNHEAIVKNIGFVAVLGAVVLFLSMADTFSVNLLVKYWKEIVAVFIAATIIRMLMMSKFAFMAIKLPFMHNVPIHWWMVLSAAGVKGGISILMLHMLPRDFEYLELFEAIVVGQILLSTFVYPFILTVVMILFKKRFEAECEQEAHH